MAGGVTPEGGTHQPGDAGPLVGDGGSAGGDEGSSIGDGGGSSNGHGDGSGDGDGGGSNGGDDGGSDDVPAAEKVVMAASVAFTVALFGVAVWYAVTGSGAVAPTVSVVESQPTADGGVAYTVVLHNPGDVGLVSATVEAGCADPPAEVVFENVPASGRRTGTVVCPPGTTDPAVSVSTWIAE